MASGRSWSRLVVLAFVMLGAQALTAGCNSVLDIEPAELDETSEPLQCHNFYNPSNECPSCDETCMNRTCHVTECLANADCRFALFNFRKCTGSACTDAKGECSGCISENPQAVELAKCLKGCGGGCALTGAATLCEGYCACMHQQCPDNEPNGTVAGGCFQACMSALPPGLTFPITDPDVTAMWQTPPSSAQLGCLWYHCEAASLNDHFHCDHAIGMGKLCINPPTEDPHTALCTYPKRNGNTPCNKSSECCSNNCTDDGVCTSPAGAR
jgi:hypothetical protein